MKAKLLLKWEYRPENYFNVRIQILDTNYDIIIENGIVEANVYHPECDNAQNIYEKLHSKIKAIFLGQQLVNTKPYTLSKPVLHKEYADGTQDITVFPACCTIKITAFNVDVVIKDKNGTITNDSCKGRILHEKEIANLIYKHCSDTTLISILSSYNSAIRNPENELIYLYEIKDALQKHFNGHKNACNALGIRQSTWKELSKLANHEPIKQGRHRGQHIGNLRNATESELLKARTIAQNFIEAYLIYLNTKEER